jgi:hypothetical protein
MFNDNENFNHNQAIIKNNISKTPKIIIIIIIIIKHKKTTIKINDNNYSKK